jgi:hypothetical protein
MHELSSIGTYTSSLPHHDQQFCVNEPLVLHTPPVFHGIAIEYVSYRLTVPHYIVLCSWAILHQVSLLVMLMSLL